MALQTKTSPPAAPLLSRPSNSSSPEPRASAAFEAYCEELANRYARQTHCRKLRWLPAILLIGGLFLGYTLMYVQLSWFFFGPSMSVAALATLVGLGSIDGLQPVRSRLRSWTKTWPVWEIVVLSVIGLCGLISAIYFGVWAAILMGTIVGASAASVFHLAIAVPVSERVEGTTQQFSKLVKGLSSHGLSELAIEEGMPRLMGPNWAPLFEAHFGYEAYRSVHQQLATIRPDLLRRARGIRNLFCDWLTLNAQHRSGPLLSLRATRSTILQSRSDQLALKKQADLDSYVALDEPRSTTSPAVFGLPHSGASDGLPSNIAGRGELVAEQMAAKSLHIGGGAEKPLGPGQGTHAHAHLHANSIQIGSLHSENLSVNLTNEQLRELAALSQFSGSQPSTPEGLKKAKYDRMLQEAWSSDTKRRKRFPKLQRFLGEEARMTAGFVLLAAFFGYLFQAGFFSQTTRQQFTDAWASVQWTSIEEIGSAFSKTFQTFANLPSTIDPIGVSGWGLGLVAVMIGLSGLRDGWAYACFAIPSSLIVLAGFSITPNEISPISIVSIVAAIVLMATGHFADGKIVDAVIDRWSSR